LFEFSLTPSSPQLSGFTLAGKPNQYFAFNEQGSLLSTTPSGDIVKYNLPNPASFVASKKWIVTTYPNGTTGLTDVAAVANNETNPGLLRIAHLPGTILQTWPIFADGDFVYATILNTTAGPFEVLVWCFCFVCIVCGGKH
jgi:hypothetical protein